jgi:hypothetical protein
LFFQYIYALGKRRSIYAIRREFFLHVGVSTRIEYTRARETSVGNVGGTYETEASGRGLGCGPLALLTGMDRMQLACTGTVGIYVTFVEASIYVTII